VRRVSEDERVDVPQATVDEEFERAEQMLADATKAHEVGISKATVVNRLYYACFHAAQAALYARGFDPRSHGQVQTRLGQELIQPGDVPRELGRFLNDMQTYRRRVDYGSGGVERDAEELLQQTAAFLDTMGQISGHDATTE
jgi:uncharacterized protein (UPF0332 family)